MTKEDKLKCLATAEEMTFEKITLGPQEDTEKYLRLFNAEYAIMDLRNAVMRGGDDEDPDDEETDAVSAAVAEDELPRQRTIENASPADKEKTYTLVEVREFLAKRAGQLDIPGILNAMGYNKLSEVPEEKYAELMQKAGA